MGRVSGPPVMRLHNNRHRLSRCLLFLLRELTLSSRRTPTNAADRRTRGRTRRQASGCLSTSDHQTSQHHEHQPRLWPRVRGCCGCTTRGLRWFRAMPNDADSVVVGGRAGCARLCPVVLWFSSVCTCVYLIALARQVVLVLKRSKYKTLSRSLVCDLEG